MIKRDDALGGGAGEMRCRALVVSMISAPTVPAGVRVGAVAAIMSRVLAMALETVWIGRETFLSFAQQ